MKKSKYIQRSLLMFFIAFIFISCEENNFEFGDIVTPTNIQITAEIFGQDADNPNGNGDGVVTFSATADDAISYNFVYNGVVSAEPTGDITYNFSVLGVNTYTVTVVAVGTGGVTSSKTIDVDVFASYEAPSDLKSLLFGFEDGSPDAETSKEWRIKSEVDGHFGVGPADEVNPIWFSAPANDKEITGMYDDRYVFNSDGTFDTNTNFTNDEEATEAEGTIFGQATALDLAFGSQGLTPNDNGEHENYVKDNYSGNWALTAPGDQETLTLTSNGFFGFYVGGSGGYSILSRTATDMTIKTIGDDGLAWFFILTTEEVGGTTATIEPSAFTNLVWGEEFDVDGAPDPASWTYDLGAGGWGNNELQTYTDNAENVIVENGVLRITAKADGNGGYTSTRLLSQGLKYFTYGRIDVRAKLPVAEGTWPAIWMLGESFATVGWPRSGEMDIMEQWGNDKETTLGTFHWFDENTNANASFGGTTAIENVATEYHIYSLEWTETSIQVLLDGVVFHTIANSSDLPFNADFFFILNIAMGGTLGGDIDPDFTEDFMEIDYVRVYQ